MNRRRLLQGVLALAGIGRVELAAAQETPAVIPAPTEIPPATVAPELSYDALVAHGLELGRQTTDLLATGEAAALFERFSPELQVETSEAQIAATLRDLTTDRVHFEEASAHLIFDGQVAGNAMRGMLQSSALVPFSLRRSDATPEPVPGTGTPFPTEALAGHWTGAATLPDGTSVGLAVDFAADGQAGTLSIRDRNVADSPLSGITFNANQPFGERTADWLMPHSPDRQRYGAVFDWGGRGLSVSLTFDAEDQIAAIHIAEEWILAPDPAADEPPLPPLRLPFEGVWWVVSGGETVGDSDHAANREQRHAVDLLIWRNGSTVRSDGATNKDYYAWGHLVLAPLDATVVEIIDGYPASTPGQLPEHPPDALGNHVVLQTGNNAFVILAHLQAGSILVEKGVRVAAGTPLGLVGNSGVSSEPHLHIHAQTYPTLRTRAAGLPMVFANVLVDGELMDTAHLRRGSFVAPG